MPFALFSGSENIKNSNFLWNLQSCVGVKLCILHKRFSCFLLFSKLPLRKSRGQKENATVKLTVAH